MFTCGAMGCLPTVFRPRGAVFTCGADIYLRCFGMFTSGGIASTAGVHLSIPPVAPADVPAMYRPLIGTSTCGAEMRLPSGGCIPAVPSFNLLDLIYTFAV